MADQDDNKSISDKRNSSENLVKSAKKGKSKKGKKDTEQEQKVKVEEKQSDIDDDQDDDDDEDKESEEETQTQEEIIQQVQQFLQKEDYDQAEQLLHKYLEEQSVHKNQKDLYLQRAEVYYAQNQFLEALRDMNQAVNLEPSLKTAQSSEVHYQIKKGLLRMSNDI